MNGKLTTHVLDTAQGCPAVGMKVELWLIDQKVEARTLLKTVQTNADGRTDTPLLIGSDFQIGVYELVFNVGEYFAHQPVQTSQLPFLNQVPIQFGVAETDNHYHVPLLVSPWSYSTYRGS